MSDTYFDAMKRKIIYFFRYLVLIITLPLILGFSAYLGYLLVSALSTKFPDWPIGVAAFGGGVILAIVKDLVKSLPSIFDFIERPSLKTITVPAMAVFIASFSLCASSKVVMRDLPTDTPPIFLNFTQPTLPIFTDDESLITFYITFDGDATRESLKTKKGSGVSIDPSDEKLLENILRDLSACSPDEQHRVNIEIRGFASSSDWSKEEQGISNEKNLQLAITRANIVKEVLDKHNEGNWFDIHIREWKDFEDMRKKLMFNDRFKERYSKQMGRLNRRVEIRLLNVANCQS